MLAEITYETLPPDVREELEDERYSGRSHYSRATYALGCHGPLCTKAERDRGRKRNESRARAKGREYTPFLAIRVDDRDELLEKIIRWHKSKKLKKAS